MTFFRDDDTRLVMLITFFGIWGRRHVRVDFATCPEVASFLQIQADDGGSGGGAGAGGVGRG